jgi:hypothetical protein
LIELRVIQAGPEERDVPETETETENGDRTVSEAEMKEIVESASALRMTDIEASLDDSSDPSDPELDET